MSAHQLHDVQRHTNERVVRRERRNGRRRSTDVLKDGAACRQSGALVALPCRHYRCQRRRRRRWRVQQRRRQQQQPQRSLEILYCAAVNVSNANRLIDSCFASSGNRRVMLPSFGLGAHLEFEHSDCHIRGIATNDGNIDEYRVPASEEITSWQSFETERLNCQNTRGRNVVVQYIAKRRASPEGNSLHKLEM